MSDTVRHVYRVMTRHLGPLTITALLRDLGSITGDAALTMLIARLTQIHQPPSQPMLDLSLPLIDKPNDSGEDG